jgi:GH3 auxin-responsive promoter
LEGPSPASSFLEQLVQPWYDCLERPSESQEGAIRGLLEGYAKTEYGRKFGAGETRDIADFQRRFPIANYASLAPYLERVKAGEHSALLPEPVVRWVMTRGTTGRPKLVPATGTHLALILSLGARAIVNFALKRDPEIMETNVLNLNFPSEVGTMATGAGHESFGYSSGSYAKFHPTLGPTALVPRQEEIDALGGGISNKDWERRFELVYRLAKDVWRMRGLFCTSVAKIQTDYAPVLRHQYGDRAPLVEMYTATEGVFAQQIDERPYVSPNYDAFLFEVRARGGRVKLLHEMAPGEWGRIVISGPLFPRYDIGDMVEAVGRNCFRVFGRAGTATTLEHVLFQALTGTFRF